MITQKEEERNHTQGKEEKPHTRKGREKPHRRKGREKDGFAVHHHGGTCSLLLCFPPIYSGKGDLRGAASGSLLLGGLLRWKAVPFGERGFQSCGEIPLHDVGGDGGGVRQLDRERLVRSRVRRRPLRQRHLLRRLIRPEGLPQDLHPGLLRRLPEYYRPLLQPCCCRRCVASATLHSPAVKCGSRLRFSPFSFSFSMNTLIHFIHT